MTNTSRPAAADVAQIVANHAYVLIANETSDGIVVFVNGNIIPNGTLESLSLNIAVPTDTAPSPVVTAILSYYEYDAAQQKQARSVALFPGTVEIIAHAKRISVTAQEADSLDGLWVGVGMNADGTSNEVHGVRALRVLITPDITDAQLTWDEDGTTEAIFPRDTNVLTPDVGTAPPAPQKKSGLFTAFGS